MSKGVLLVMLVACAFYAPTLAQEPLAPARVGSLGVVQPRLLREVIPEYPNLAQGARVQGRVTVEATIDATGRVSGVKITQSNPLLDDAALTAVRQWEFAQPVVDGQARPVVTTVTVDFRLYGAIAPQPPVTAAVSPSGTPPDFVILYKEEACSLPINLTSITHDLDGIYRALSADGLLSGDTGLTRWQEPPPSHATVLADRIEIAVAGGNVFLDCQSDGGGGSFFRLIVRASGTWTQLWPPPARSEFQTTEYEQRVSAVRNLIQKAIAGK